MNYTFHTTRHKLVASCRTDLKDPVNDLFMKLNEIDKKEPPLRNGTTIDFGWSRLMLKGDERELVIHEPDFNHNPLSDFLPQVDTTLDVLTRQVSVLNLLRIRGTLAYYSHHVILSKGCLGKEKIYLERSEGTQKDDTGWFIGDVDNKTENDSPENFEILRVFELLQKRPALMQVLALPPGFLVIFLKDRIVQVFDEAGKNLWTH
jgi:hypothetical protein